MKINDDSYLFIKQVADQIEGLTSSLIIFIESAGSELECYHYEAFNKFSNEVRNMGISSVKEIKEEFGVVKEVLEEVAVKIGAKERSTSRLIMELIEINEVFSRLVIHSENIREFYSETTNPFVPNAKEKIYKVFSGYDKLLNQYQVNKPDVNDPFCSLMYSFFCTASSTYERLFKEFNSLLLEFGLDIEERRRNLKALEVIKKRENGKAIANAAFGVAKTAAFVALGIKKKNVFDVLEKGIGLIAKISDTLDELDELKYVKPVFCKTFL
jgi:hypothetical protein